MNTPSPRATKAQLIDHINEMNTHLVTAVHTARESNEQANTALVVAIVAFCLGLLF
jgi:hypothetical protein